MTRWAFATALILACVGLAELAVVSVASSQGTPPRSAPLTAGGDDQVRRQAILQQLGASEFAERDAAQKQLDKMTWRDLDWLRQAARTVTDPEIQARLATRLAALEEEMAADPPPVSLELKGASYDVMVDALSRITGTRLDGGSMVIPATENFTYTLSAHDEPFWQVFQKLSAQHEFSFVYYDGSRLGRFGPGPGWQAGTVVGPVAVFPLTIERQQVSQLQRDRSKAIEPETMSLYYVVAVDPRVRIIDFIDCDITDVIDSKGNVLRKAKFQKFVAGSRGFSQDETFEEHGVSLQIPPDLGKTIASAKGQASFRVPLIQQKVDIADPETKGGQKFKLAGTTVTLKRFALQGDKPALTGVEMELEGKENADARPGYAEPAVAYVVTDATGSTICNGTFREQGSVKASEGHFLGPVVLHLSIPTKIKEVTASFELKDLPLPGGI